MRTLASQLPLHGLLEVLDQVKAIRDLLGGGRTTPASFRQ
jgi:hypothetical protein